MDNNCHIPDLVHKCASSWLLFFLKNNLDLKVENCEQVCRHRRKHFERVLEKKAIAR